MKWGWILVTLYLGPIALVLYILSCKKSAPGRTVSCHSPPAHSFQPPGLERAAARQLRRFVFACHRSPRTPQRTLNHASATHQERLR